MTDRKVKQRMSSRETRLHNPIIIIIRLNIWILKGTFRKDRKSISAFLREIIFLIKHRRSIFSKDHQS